MIQINVYITCMQTPDSIMPAIPISNLHCTGSKIMFAAAKIYFGGRQSIFWRGHSLLFSISHGRKKF